MIRLLLLPILFFSLPTLADEIVGAQTEGTDTQLGSSGQTNPMSQEKISCLLQSEGIDATQANETAGHIHNAIERLKLDTSKLTPTAMVHFLAQIKSESGAGKNNTEGGKSGLCTASSGSSSKGYGLIQVTGAQNLKSAEDCINRAQPGAGNGISTNPEQTVGNCAKDQDLPAMVSLCWWKQNIMDNNDNNKYALEPSSDYDDKISHIVNGGSPNAQMSSAGASSLSTRGQDFATMLNKERSCGTDLISYNY